jgi:hypothetical protein
MYALRSRKGQHVASKTNITFIARSTFET